MPHPHTTLHDREPTPDPRPPLSHDPPPPPGYVDPVGHDGVLSDLAITSADGDAQGADAEEHA